MDRPFGIYRGTCGADVLQLISSCGVNSISILDVHSEVLLGAVPNYVRCKNIYADPIIEKVFEQIPCANLMIVAPDTGAIKTCRNFIDFFKCKNGVELDFALVDKVRKEANQVHAVQLISGVVAKRTCLILDDMIDTGVCL